MYRALDGQYAQGLQVRYNLYLCYPRIADSALVQDFAAGRKTENPAIGWVLGTIAAWRPGEPESLTLGRGLNPAQSYANQYRTDFKPYFLAPAVARVSDDAALVSIDLVNTLPEDGKDGEKFPHGRVQLGVRKATAPGADPAANPAPVTPVGTIENDRRSFERYGGVYDLPVADAATRDLLADPGNELVLHTERFGVLLYEPEFFVGSDCEAAYLDAAPPGSQDPAVRPPIEPGSPLPQPLRGWVPVFVRRRGRVPDGKVTLGVEQWKFTPTGDPDPTNSGLYRFPSLIGAETIEVEAGLAAHVLHPSDGPGVRMFRYVAPGQWPQPLDGAALANAAYREAYTFVRVLPYDDGAARITDAELSYDAVYQHVFRYYALILPAMTKRLDMSGEGAALWETPTAARYLLRTTELDMWEHWAYMPRTRDLSATRRDLLRRYCRKILAARAIAVTC